METFESPCSVAHGGTTLVSIGTPMWEPVRVNGGLAVQRAGRVRSLSMLVLARGNESNTLTFAICVENAGPAAACEAALKYAISLPKVMADVTIAFAAGSMVMHEAVVSGWDCGTVEQLGRYQVSITGGVLHNS